MPFFGLLWCKCFLICLIIPSESLIKLSCTGDYKSDDEVLGDKLIQFISVCTTVEDKVNECYSSFWLSTEEIPPSQDNLYMGVELRIIYLIKFV